MMELITWINQNPGVCAVAAIFICAIGIALFLTSRLRAQRRRSAWQLKRLEARIAGENAKLNQALLIVNQTMGGAAAQLRDVAVNMEQKQDQLRLTVDERMERMQRSNEQRLEQMRASMNEQMQKTLEARLGESFRVVSGQLENVYRGLGEMRGLAAGVGDLKKVLTNVKTRGIWGEVRLRALISENLTRSQYEENVNIVKGTQERVEFAVRLPGKESEKPVYLPVDSKFPQEDYLRLIKAREDGAAEEIARCETALERAVTEEAKRISSKYLSPPDTTDFAIMFLPVESLYGEVMARPGLCERLQKQYRVLPSGPSAFSALLNCLQMGFRTLAVEKRSGEILIMLGGVRQEFARFGETLDKARARLEQAAGDLDSVGVRTRAINRRLNELGADIEKQPE